MPCGLMQAVLNASVIDVFISLIKSPFFRIACKISTHIFKNKPLQIHILMTQSSYHNVSANALFDIYVAHRIGETLVAWIVT